MKNFKNAAYTKKSKQITKKNASVATFIISLNSTTDRSIFIFSSLQSSWQHWWTKMMRNRNKEEGMGGWGASVKELQGEIKMSRVYEEVKEKEGKYGATSWWEGEDGEDGWKTEEGDKVKECSETTGPLFLLKELPRHFALFGRGELCLQVLL